MKLKFVSDGTQEGTRVVDNKTGEMLENVQGIVYFKNVNEFSILNIRIIEPDIDVKLINDEYGTVHYYTSQNLSNKLIAYRENIEDSEGNHIPNIIYAQIIADTNNIRMTLTSLEYGKEIDIKKEYRLLD